MRNKTHLVGQNRGRILFSINMLDLTRVVDRSTLLGFLHAHVESAAEI